MKKITSTISALTIALLFFSLASFGQEQKITLVTTKAVGEPITIAVNNGISIAVNWGDGIPVLYSSTGEFITGEAKDDSITITGEGITLLDCSNNALSALNVSKATLLQSLICHRNQLTELNINSNKLLVKLRCSENQLTALSTAFNPALKELICYDNQLTALTVSRNTALTTLICSYNQLSKLVTSYNLKLETLWCQDNQIESLDLSKNTKLTSLLCYNNKLTALSTEKTQYLTDIFCGNNSLTYLDIKTDSLIETISCENNLLDSIALPPVAPRSFYCADNALRYSSLYYQTKVANYSYSPQDSFLVGDAITTDDVVDLMKETLTADGYNVTPKYYVKDATGTVLVKGEDYKLMGASGKFQFLKPQSNIYFEIKTTRFDSLLSIVSKSFNVAPGPLSTPEEALNSFSWYVQNGVLIVNITEPMTVTITNILGQPVRSGYLESGTYEYRLQPGVYMLNGEKIIL
ncbi:MAG: hypothetical protein PHI48_07220 [Bacteroidales bacterium]|nr:hypothetical protein [Bacteroidales bacterium]MDD4822333.1 hypothetical protein [Bacteroidales bacterium]